MSRDMKKITPLSQQVSPATCRGNLFYMEQTNKYLYTVLVSKFI